MTGTGAALHATVAVSVLAGVPLAVRAMRSGVAEGAGTARWWCRPGWWLAVVVLILFGNQVLFTVYALRVHGGDMSYLGGYIPDGWFVLADGSVMTWLADRWPAPDLLALSALRIPSLFELPLGVLAYLTVLNWLDPSLYRRLTGTAVLALMCASYTITFGLIEWAMHTTYTMQNLALRAVSGVLTVVALRRLARLPSAPPGSGAPRTAAEFLAFAASTAALGFLVLSLYDSVLLYSMGRVGAHLPGALAAAALLVASRLAATRLRRRPAGPAGAGVGMPAVGSAGRGVGTLAVGQTGPGLATLTAGLSWWLALFMIPALAIRYELGFGRWELAAGAGLLIIAVASVSAIVEVYRSLPVVGRTAAARRWLLGLAVAGLSAGAAAAAGLAVPAVHPEMRLLSAAALFVLIATAVCAVWDRPSATVPAG